MKIKNLTAVVLMCLFSANAMAQCQANFTWTQTSNNTIAFTDASTGLTGPTMYQWNFGDGNYSSSQNPVNVFNIPGTYYVCLNLLDSNMLGSCSSSFCDSVTVTGTVICNLSLSFTTTVASCATCADGTVQAGVTGGMAPYAYSWQTVPPQTSSYITGLLPGTYTCCVTDVNGCTACSAATITTTSCQANFSANQTSNNVIAFTNTSTGTGPMTDYYWNFGDNNYSYTQNPVHTYNVAGTYFVCLQISDTNNFLGPCNSTFCDSVVVTGVNCNNLSVSVAATNTSCTTCNDGSAVATPSGGTPPYSFQWNNASTTQSITNLTSGYYSCCITDALGCTACAGAIVGSNLMCSSYFTLTPDIIPQTYTAVNYATGVPPFSFVWSWGDATYDYTPFPTHTYAAPGLYTICLTITDTTFCTSTYCDSFNVARLQTSNSAITINVVPPSASGIPNPNLSPETIFVYPNPADNQLTITGYLSDVNSIGIYDVLGEKVKSELLSASSNRFTMNVADLTPGIYFVKTKGETGERVAKFVKE